MSLNYIAFDLDGTLAKHRRADGSSIDYSREIGEPVPAMVELAKKYLAEGVEIRIVTARMSQEWGDADAQRAMIGAWCREHLGITPVIQAHKSGGMICLYDDLAIGVVADTGILLHEHEVMVAVAYERGQLLNYGSANYIESDPGVALSDEHPGSIAISFCTGNSAEEDHYVSPREARVLATRLLRAAHMAEAASG